MASSKASKKEAREIIEALEAGDYVAECPWCGAPMRLKDAGLFYLDDFTDDAADLYKQYTSELKERRKDLRERRKKISARSEIAAASINVGKILERICPSLRTFSHDKNDCRALLDPIDYVIFEGLAATGKVSRIIFAEVKSEGIPLFPWQRQIKSLVEEGKVEFDIYGLEKQ